MLTIIEIQPGADGCHALQSQSHRTECWLEGWVAVPKELIGKVWECDGYCQLQMKDGILTGITPTQRPEPPEPEPTPEEQLRADVDYLAAMIGVDCRTGAHKKDTLVDQATAYYPRLWSRERLEALVTAGHLTQSQYEAIAGKSD